MPGLLFGADIIFATVLVFRDARWLNDRREALKSCLLSISPRSPNLAFDETVAYSKVSGTSGAVFGSVK